MGVIWAQEGDTTSPTFAEPGPFSAADGDHNPLSASAQPHGPPPPYESLMLSREVTVASACVAEAYAYACSGN